MTSEERIRLIRDRIGRIGDVALGIDVTWLCDYALSLMTVNGEYWSAIYGDLYRDALEKLETGRAVLRDVKEFAEEKITALEKERDELRESISLSVNTLRDADESEMEPDTWAAVIVAIDALEGRQ